MPDRKRSVNPQFREPRDYMKRGLYQPGTQEPLDGLHGEWAMAMGRECLIRGVPLEVVGQLVRELEGVARSAGGPMADNALASFAQIAAKAEYRRHTLLAQLLSAGLAVVKRPADIGPMTAHVRRIYALANFTRALGQANTLEAIAQHRRGKRVAQVRKQRPTS